MIDLNPFYFTIIGAALLAGALAMAGAHLAARQNTLQSLSLSQGAEIGALTSALCAFYFQEFLNLSETWIGLAGSLLGAFGTGTLADLVSKGQSSSRTPRLLALWVSLVALTHLSVALHPALESHLTRVFLGDLATLSDMESSVVAAISISALFVFAVAGSSVSKCTFDISTMGQAHSKYPPLRHFLLSTFPFLLLPALSTWSAGFLFTCALLFIPTALLAQDGDSSQKHTFICFAIGAMCTPIGLVISLQSSALPTVPAIVAAVVLGCAAVVLCRRLYQRASPDASP